jgi:hypothetical protein
MVAICTCRPRRAATIRGEARFDFLADIAEVEGQDSGTRHGDVGLVEAGDDGIDGDDNDSDS